MCFHWKIMIFHCKVIVVHWKMITFQCKIMCVHGEVMFFIESTWIFIANSWSFIEEFWFSMKNNDFSRKKHAFQNRFCFIEKKCFNQEFIFPLKIHNCWLKTCFIFQWTIITLHEQILTFKKDINLSWKTRIDMKHYNPAD